VQFWWVGVTLSFFFFLTYLSSLTSPWNRLEMAWSRHDILPLIFILSLGGGLCVLGWLTLKRMVQSEKIRTMLFILVFFLVVWPYFDSRILTQHFLLSKVWEACKILLLILLGYFLLKYPFRCKSFLKSFLLIISPVVGVFLFRTLFFSPIPVMVGTLSSVSPSKSSSPPVLFILFDEWSYDRTFINRNPKAIFTTLQSLVSTAIVFHQALSPGIRTIESVPILLGDPVFQKAKSQSPLIIKNSLFRQAKERGWENVIVGSYLPYPLWFGNDIQFGLQAPDYKNPRPTFIESVQSHLALGLLHPLSYWKIPFGQAYYNHVNLRNQKRRVAYVHKWAKKSVKRSGNKTFTFVHYSLPHDPFLSVNTIKFPSNPIQGYEGNILYADRLLQDLIQSLKEQEIWDKSLVIVTSDHGWKTDPSLQNFTQLEALNKQLRHVPLMVKMPFQNTRIDVDSPYDLVRLKTLLSLIFKTDFSQKRLIFKENKFSFLPTSS